MSEQEEIVKLWKQVRDLREELNNLKQQLKIIQNSYKMTADLFRALE